MSGWASLSGYLHLKPGGGGLSLLKTRRRLWCVLEESQGRLLYFKSEEDSRSKSPLGYVELRGAAITLDMDNHNQFVIIVDGKEILLTAENHESMMIWMMALQARRDQFASAEKSRTSSTSTDNELEPDHHCQDLVESRGRSSSDLTIVRMRNDYTTTANGTLAQQQHLQPRPHRPLESTQSLQGQGQAPTVGFLGLSPDWRRGQLKQMGETVDSGNASAKKSALSFLQSSYRQNASTEMSETAAVTQQMPPKGAAISWSGSSTSTDNGEDFSTLGLSRSFAGRDPMLGTRNRSGSLQSVASSDRLSSQDGDKLSDLEKELIATKCELAKVLNRQTTYQEILKQKDEIIEDLDGKLGSRSANHDAYDSKRRGSSINKEHQERIRVLQNQNRFLNEEVRRLAKLRNQEHDKIKVRDGKVRSLEADIEVWKLEYISLIQSSIRFTGTDTMDDAELSLYGGDRHKHRIISLLEEARKINPSLPTFEHLASGEVHVDCYGFKHHFSDDGLLLHYLCQELSQHFLSQASSYEKHQKDWHVFLKNKSKNMMSNRKDLKVLVRGGIPDPHRKQVWRAFVMSQVEDIALEKGAHYYRSLCNSIHDSPMAARYRKQISLDLMRTMPSNVKFSTPGSKGVMDLQDVLLAFCVHNPQVGYCQGMNFLVAMALLFMDAQDAFWTLVAVTERYHSPSYFDHNLLGAQADQMVLHDLMAEKMPELAKHLDAIDIEISTVTLNWFLAIFFDAVPFHTLLRVWDCFLLEGPKVLFRFSLAILHIHSKEIILKCDTISVMRHLKASARITYDVDGLVRAAFKTLKPFPRRQDIVSKQTCYLNALKEKYRWRDMQRVSYVERENLFMSMECDAENYTGFECCTATKSGEAWVAYGEPPNAKICIVDCREQTMTDTSIKFDTRVMSMSCVAGEMALIGTLSWFVYGYNVYTREMAWQQRVHDAVLSMQVYKDDDGDHSYRLFAGLADGTVAVFENISLTCTSYDLLYLPIGQSPITCLQLLGNQLWCACGNKVYIIHASTLDPMDSFCVSGNPYDAVLSLVPSLAGVWISVRGSSVLELWDPMSLSCKMLYDTRTGRYPNLRKEDDTYFNAARITSILALDYSVWVGTGEGTLITFDVFTKNLKTPSENSPFLTDNLLSVEAEMQSWRSSLSQKGDVDSYARLLEVEKRVRDLYVQRLSGDFIIGKDTFETSNDAGTDESGSSWVEKQQHRLNMENDDCVRTGMGVKRERLSRRKAFNHVNNDTAGSASSDSGTKNKTLAGENKGNAISKQVESKANLCKTISVDSGRTTTSAQTETSDKTDFSQLTNISADSSGIGHTAVAGIFSEGFTPHEPGFIHNSCQSSGSSTRTENSLNDTLRDATSCDDVHASVHTSPSSNSLPQDDVPTHPTVYYLFRNDTEENTPKGQTQHAKSEAANSKKTPNFSGQRNDSGQDQTESEGTKRTFRKSEDSGFSSLYEKSGEDVNDQGDNNNKRHPLERASTIESSQNESSMLSNTEEFQNRKNKLQRSSTADMSIEGCINAASTFYSTSDSAVQSMSNSVTGDALNKLDSKSFSLDSNGCHESQDHTSIESDDVFHAAETSSSLVSSDSTVTSNKMVSHTENDGSVPPAKKETTQLNSQPAVNESVSNMTNGTTEKTIPNGILLNGHLSDGQSSEDDISTKVEAEETVSELKQAKKFAKVRSIAAQFEAKGGYKEEMMPKNDLRRTKSLKRNFRPSVQTQIKSEKPETIPNGGPNYVSENVKTKASSGNLESETKDVQPSEDKAVESVITNGPEVTSYPSNENAVDSDETKVKPPSDITASGHNKLQRLNGKTQNKAEIIAAATQLGKELENCQPVFTLGEQKTDPLKPNMEEKSQQQSDNSTKVSSAHDQKDAKRQIDTTYYGDSDEDSSVHEARVQSFKDSYKRMSAGNLKFRMQNETIPENSTVSQTDNTGSSPGSAGKDTGSGSESKQRAESSSSGSGTEVCNRKSSTSGQSSNTSDVSKKMSVSSIGRQSSEASIVIGNVQSRDPEAQWRLDYTNIHIDTDKESLNMSSASVDGEGDIEVDIHSPSRRLSGFSASSEMKDQRLNQFLRDTASTFTSQFGYPLDDDKVNAFLSTPTMSGCNSACWSSYDEISTPPQVEGENGQQSQNLLRFPSSSAYSMGSRTTSVASTLDLFYGADLSLLSKNKISDKPVKWLISTECKGKPVILSFSGSHSDDEAVLIWSREANETLWTNCPVFEYDPATRMATLPRYMRPQLSSSSSTRSSPRQRLASLASN